MASWFAGLRSLAGARAAGELAADAVVSLRMADGGEASFPLPRLKARQVVAAVPWRKTRSARGQVHYRGFPGRRRWARSPAPPPPEPPPPGTGQLRDLTRQGYGPRKSARITGCSERTIRQLLTSAGLRPPTARPDGAIDLRWLREQYQDCKRSLKDIAAETGIPVEALAAAARQAGTPCAGHPGQPGMADRLIFGCYQEVPVFTFREIPNFPVLDPAFAHGIGFMWPCVRTIMKHAPPGPAGIVLFG